MQLSPALARLAASQAGAVSLAQLKAHGITKSAAAHAVRSQAWQGPLRGVYLLHSGPVLPDAQRWSAVLYAGVGAALSHGTAASLYGWPNGDTRVHVVVSSERSVSGCPGVVVHRMSLSQRDTGRRSGLPVTSPARTVVDLLTTTKHAEQALNIVALPIQRGQVSADDLVQRLTEDDVRWRRILLPALVDMAAGSHSGLEIAFAKLLRRHGLPVGLRQVPFGATRVDMCYPTFVVELDGRLGHYEPWERWRDKGRDNMHAVGGRLVLRFGWHDVQTDPCGVARQVAALLDQSVRGCRKGCRS